MSDGNNSNELIESPFDMEFQLGLLKMALTDDSFCTSLIKYLGKDVLNPKTKYDVFESELIKIIFNSLQNFFIRFGARPNEGQLKQEIKDSVKESRYVKHEDILILIDKIYSINITITEPYRNKITEFVKQSKTYLLMSIVKEKVKNQDINSIPAIMIEMVEDINKVSFSENDVVTMKDIKGFLIEASNSLGRSIPTGIKPLDADLYGGLPRQTLVTVLSGTNVGKSMFCCSIACNALRAVDAEGVNLGLKVLFVALEGRKDESIMRMCSNLANVEYSKLISNNLTAEESKRIEEVTLKYDDKRLRVKNVLEFNLTIEELIAYCKDVYKEFAFDMVIVDYGQLLSTQQKVDAHRHTMGIAYRGLTNIARRFNCVVISPVQATRDAQKELSQELVKQKMMDKKRPVLRSSDMSESMEIARVSGIILSLNMTDDERHEGKLRVFLEKQRHGVKGTEYGLLTEFPVCNLIPGRLYNTKSEAIVGDFLNLNNGSFSETKTLSDVSSVIAEPSKDISKLVEKLDIMSVDIKSKMEEIDRLNQDLKEEKEFNPLEMGDQDSKYAEIERTYNNKRDEISEILSLFMDDFYKLTQWKESDGNEQILEKIKKSLDNIKSELDAERAKDGKEKDEKVLKLEKAEARFLLAKKIIERGHEYA